MTVLLVFLAAPASSQAAFTFIGTVSGSGAGGPEVAVAPNGDAVFGWTKFDATSQDCCDRVYARPRSATGALGAVQMLSAPGQNAYLSEIGIDADGDAVFAWSSGGVVQTRVRSADGSLSPIQTLSQDPSSPPQLAVAGNGRAVFAWAAGGRVRARARSATGALSPVQILSGFRGVYPDVAIDSDGDSVFVWRLEGRDAGCDPYPDDPPQCKQRFQGRARSAGGALSPVHDLSDGGAYPLPHVDVDSDGDAVFAWLRLRPGGLVVETRALSAAGVLSPVQEVSDSPENYAPDVGVDADGNAVFVWRRRCAGSSFCGSMRTRARSATGVLGPIQVLSNPHPNLPSPHYPHVAVDADGDAVFTWIGDDGTTQCGGGPCNRTFARSRSASGVLSPLQTVSPAGQPAAHDEVAINANGDAAATWQRLDGTSTSCCSRIQAAVQPAP